MSSEKNSTVSLLQLWHLCITEDRCRTSRESRDRSRDVIHWDILRQALIGLGNRVQMLECNSVDDILNQHFRGRRLSSERDFDHVNFTQYWIGMEAILQACGVFNRGGGVNIITEERVASLRSFRDAVLDRDCTVLQLRSLCEQLAHASEHIADFWQEKLALLNNGEDSEVTSDEIAVALRTWLVELLEDFLGDDVEDMRAIYSDSETSSRSSEGGPVDAAAVSGSTLSRGFQLPEVPAVPAVPSPIPRFNESPGKPAFPLNWLAPADHEPHDIQRFREQLDRYLGSGSSDTLTLTQLYRGVRTILVPPSVATRAAAQAGCHRLACIFRCRIRYAFRSWELYVPEPAPNTMFAELICSQARAAKLLEQRGHFAGSAFDLATILSRVRARHLGTALGRWRDAR